MQKTLCEFFAGIGLVDEALRASGWRCIYSNDIDAKKQAMHAGHFGASEHYHLGDVWDAAAVLERIAEPPFLATASFPCTDMSLAGKRRGFGGAESSALFGFLRVVDELGGEFGDKRPRMLLLENVPGFLNSHGGRDFATAVDELASRDYWVDSFVIDARWFVPQSRPRLFLVGYHESIADSPRLIRRKGNDWFGTPWQQAVNSAGELRPAKLRAAIDNVDLATGWITVDSGQPRRLPCNLLEVIDVGDDQPWWNAKEVARHEAMLFDRHRDKIAALAARGTETFAMTGYRRMREGRQRLEIRFDGIAGCLRTPRGGSAKQIVVVVDRGALRMRWMTPREYARLQGAGEYVLPTNTIQGLFGFGDAVCVPVIRWIDDKMLTPVFESVSQSDQPSHARPVLAR